jgi:hypothetical protein
MLLVSGEGLREIVDRCVMLTFEAVFLSSVLMPTFLDQKIAGKQDNK